MRQEQVYTEGASQQRSVSNGRSKVRERVALLVLSVLLAAAVIVIIRLSFEYMHTVKSFHTLRGDHEALERNLTAGSFPKCEDGWEQFGEKCYYFSVGSSPWEKARDECRHQRGDLVKIDSREEQSFLELKLRTEMVTPEDKFWIGLTDSEKEGTWLWTDGSPLNPSLTFWSPSEPDNWARENPNGEDCARMGQKAEASDLKCWFDKDCNMSHRHICEKSAQTRRLKVET